MKSKIVLKSLAGVLSVATLTGLVTLRGVKAYYNDAPSSNKKIIASAIAGAAGGGTLCSILFGLCGIAGLAVYISYLDTKYWNKLKNLTNLENTRDLQDAIKLIDEIVGSIDKLYEEKKLDWVSKLTKAEIDFRYFFKKILSIKSQLQCGDRLRTHVANAFVILSNIDEKHKLTDSIRQLKENIEKNKEAAKKDAENLKEEFKKFNENLTNLRSAIWMLYHC